MDRPALLGGEHAWCHAGKLLVMQVHQQGEHDLQRKTGPCQHPPRAIETDEAIVGDEGTACRREVSAEPFEEWVKQASSIHAGRAPARQATGQRVDQRAVRQVGHDQVEATSLHRAPQVAADEFCPLPVAEPIQKQAAGGDGILLDIDPTQRCGAETSQCRQHDAAA